MTVRLDRARRSTIRCKRGRSGVWPVYFGTAVVLFSVIEWIEIVQEAVGIWTVKSGRLKFRVG